MFSISRSQILLHIKQMHPVGSFNCQICFGRFGNANMLFQHKRHSHMPGRFQCAKCNFVARYRGVVIDHYMAEHGEGNVNNKKLVKESPKKHMKRKRSTSPHSATNTATDLNQNKYTVIFLKCILDDCVEFVLTWNELVLHLREEHRLKQLVCAASKCNESFYTRYSDCAYNYNLLI